MQLRQILFLIIIGISCLVSNSVGALELSVLQNECAEIGFKIKTEGNGKCVLQLMDKFNSKPINQGTTIDDVSGAQQRTIERQRQYEKDAELVQKQHEIDGFKRQQAEMYELQRRSYTAQEAAANAQRDEIANERSARAWGAVGRSLEKLSGTGAYAPRPPVTCITNGNITRCN